MTINKETNDIELIQNYLKGENQAFDILYERYKTIVYSFICHMLGKDFSNADDIFQETWIRAISNFHKYQNQEKFIAWIMTIARNRVMDLYRDSNRNFEEELDDNIQAEKLSSSGHAAWRDLDNESLSKALSDAVNRLTPMLREVFLLRKEDIPFREIAKIQGCSINTCLARYQYALQQLRKILSEWKP